MVSNPVTAQGMVANPGVVDAGSPAHAPAPRPVVVPAGAPDAPFLARCDDAKAALAAELEAAIDDAQRAAMVKRLGEHYQLCWDLAATRRPSLLGRVRSFTGDGGGASDAEVPASFDTAAKALLTLAMRYPASAAPLAQGAFAWDVPPLRAGGEAVVEHALHAWGERTSSAADSAMFSSMGPWISPFSWPVWTVVALAFTFVSLARVSDGVYKINLAFWTGQVCTAVGIAAVATLLRAGRRELARWACAVSWLAFAAGCAAEAALSSCKCWGPYAETHTEGGDPGTRGYLWQYTWYAAVCALSGLSLAGISTHPHRAFELIFVVFPFLVALAAAPMAATDHQFFEYTTGNNVTLTSFVTGLATYLWAGRKQALAKARRMAVEDAARYVRLWGRLVAAESFRAELRLLEGAWREVQGGALRLPKRQLGAPTLHALLVQADELNDLLQAKLYDVCAAHGGEHHACGIKAEKRALQKVFRSYKGDWRRLGDLCRTTLVFDNLTALEACLRAIGADAELHVVHAGDEKMRLRERFDAAALSGGYRDIQLCARLDTEEARARGVHEHLCEVQLHFAPIIALKGDGGHKTYVLRRNLSGQ
jgi:hypothetical protein